MSSSLRRTSSYTAEILQVLPRKPSNRRRVLIDVGGYDYPKIHPKLGPLSPAPDDVARALARETGSRAQIAGAHAANALGLSVQVPAKSLYLTDGPSRRIVLGKRVVDLRHASPKHLIAPGSPAGTVVQALRHVGPVRADDVARVAVGRLSASDKKVLVSNAVQATASMRPTLISIGNTPADAVNG